MGNKLADDELVLISKGVNDPDDAEMISKTQVIWCNMYGSARKSGVDREPRRDKGIERKTNDNRTHSEASWTRKCRKDIAHAVSSLDICNAAIEIEKPPAPELWSDSLDNSALFQVRKELDATLSSVTGAHGVSRRRNA